MAHATTHHSSESCARQTTRWKSHSSPHNTLSKWPEGRTLKLVALVAVVVLCGCGGSLWLWWFFVAVVVLCGCSVYSEINLNTILSELFLFQI